MARLASRAAVILRTVGRTLNMGDSGMPAGATELLDRNELILGTSESEGNIRFGNSRAKFLCVVKMFIYVHIEQAERDVKRLQRMI
jgi:hypothetical protein